ncbi:Fermitin family-like 2 [Papilio xuthus]|uniref:Fermitin family-like 2 n=1 Tax=Papilio xuthus TaxID=66420 RepID=A0A194Q7U1_PAPXU|nr:Fermitin family-like 2 [Papilio xuthus]
MLADGEVVGDGSWNLTIYVTDLNEKRTMVVKGDMHIGGVMLKLTESFGVDGHKCPVHSAVRLRAGWELSPNRAHCRTLTIRYNQRMQKERGSSFFVHGMQLVFASIHIPFGRSDPIAIANYILYDTGKFYMGSLKGTTNEDSSKEC